MSTLKNRLGKTVLRDIVEDVLESIASDDEKQLWKDLSLLKHQVHAIEQRIAGKEAPLEY